MGPMRSSTSSSLDNICNGLHGCALYDALYLALSQRLAIPFITADGKLYRMIRHLPYVVWIGDYSPGEPG